jgi:hypothetical protein
MTWPAPGRALAYCRRSRLTGALFFVLVMLLVGAERRLAEVHFNTHTAAPALNGDDILEGDEIRVRLVVLNDDRAPIVAHGGCPVGSTFVQVVRSSCETVGRGRPTPRGPPGRPSSRA